MNSRALMVDDHLLFAEAVRPHLEAAGVEVVAVVATQNDAVAAVRQYRPTLALVDLRLAGESGLAVGSRILEEAPQTRVVALTATEEPGSVREALRLGFQGYLTKDISIREFVDAVRTALDGQVVVSRRSAPAVVGERSSPLEQAGRLAEHLTGREREVLSLIAEGAGSREISSRLHIAPNTVRTHVQSILTKLQVHSRLEAAAFAVRHGVVEVEQTRRYA